ncbi:uncharacterized protein [Diadema antillarum]|uniref:uncharacterized protein n=1 Tax=Diadema antillarum TaxID=105358 RepID=UPI003A88E8EC
MAGGNSLAKEFHSLMKHIKKFSDGQVTITEWDEESLSWFRVLIEPNDGLYKDAEFEFEIDTLNDGDYPETAPKITCKTGIYHPNIDTITQSEGDVCLNLLDELWTLESTLEDVILGLLFLLYNPNIEDPLCSIITPDIEPEEFEENVARSLAGKDIDGYHYFYPNPKYARLHPERCHVERDENEGEEEEQKKDEEKKEEAGENKDKEDEDEAEEEQMAGNVTEHVSQVEREEMREAEDKSVSVATEESMNEQLEKCREITNYECRNEHDEEEAENTQKESELIDRTDDDVVSDEDLERIFDKCTFVEETNMRNSGGATSDCYVSWSNIIYGTDSYCTVNVGKFCEQCTTVDYGYPIIGCTVCQHRTAKDPACIGLRTRSERTPTVTSRFFLALQTRSFRRWFL